MLARSHVGNEAYLCAVEILTEQWNTLANVYTNIIRPQAKETIAPTEINAQYFSLKRDRFLYSNGQ
jgi:hypothetical protein